MLVALVSFAVDQAKIIETTAQTIVQMLDYCTTRTKTTIHYKENDVVIYKQSDSSYLS